MSIPNAELTTKIIERSWTTRALGHNPGSSSLSREAQPPPNVMGVACRPKVLISKLLCPQTKKWTKGTQIVTETETVC